MTLGRFKPQLNNNKLSKSKFNDLGQMKYVKHDELCQSIERPMMEYTAGMFYYEYDQ